MRGLLQIGSLVLVLLSIVIAEASPQSCRLIYPEGRRLELFRTVLTKAVPYATDAGALMTVQSEIGMNQAPRIRVTIDFPPDKQIKLTQFVELPLKPVNGTVEISRIDIDIEADEVKVIPAKTKALLYGDTWVVSQTASHSVGVILPLDRDLIDAGYARGEFYFGQLATPDMIRSLEIAKLVFFTLHPHADEVVLKTKKAIFKSLRDLSEWMLQ